MLRSVLSISEHLIWAFFCSWTFISEYFYWSEHLFLSIFIELSIYIWAYFSTWAFLSEHIFPPEHFYLSIFFHLSIIIWALLVNWASASKHFFQAEHFKNDFPLRALSKLTIPEPRGYLFCILFTNYQPPTTQTTKNIDACNVGARWCGCILTKFSSETKIMY